MKEMAQASQTQQVLSVTHLPQVAAQAEHHWEVRKTTDGASTHVEVVKLSEQERHQAIATMLSGENVTSEALGQARQLMASS
jgi:DNA repair protein RecN (Recombination protein N)